MASSGSYDFSITRDQIIDLAYQHIGLVAEGASATSAQVTEASRLMNMLMKLWSSDGMPMWALKRGYILPFSGASSVATDSHVVTAYDTTTLSADEAASQTVLSVTSSSGMSASDQVGIELTSGDIQWTTIVSVDSSTQITITTALTGAAASGNRVYAYTASTDRVQKPIRILQANILTVADNTSIEITVEDRGDYFNLSNRTSEGDPYLIYYTTQPTSDTALNTNGQIFVYPRFQDGDSVIEFTYHRPFQDFDSSTDNPDCPQEFYLPLMIGLAALLAPRALLPIPERKFLHEEALFYKELALQTYAPEGSMIIQPEDGRRD